MFHEPGIDDDFYLPNPIMDPSMDVQQQLNTSRDAIQTLRVELRQAELEAQKKRLVDTFYNEISRAYGLRPEGRIYYEQFGVGADCETLYRTPGHKNTPITAMRGIFWFLALQSLATKYGDLGTYALRRSLGFTGYTSRTVTENSSLRKHSDRQTKPSRAILKTSNSKIALA